MSAAQLNNSICLFSTYSNKDVIDPYIRVYIEELGKYFETIILVTNERFIAEESNEWLFARNITLKYVKNEGYDFGMWYKVLMELDTSLYRTLALINDSCILFRPLDEVMNRLVVLGYDYCGLVSSHRFSYHVQSFFIVINQKALPFVIEYFNQTGIILSYKKVIEKYELGLCAYLHSKGVKIGALYESLTLNASYNPSFYVLSSLLSAGMPLIKKKIINRSYRPLEYIGLLKMKFDIDQQRYIKEIDAKWSGERLLVNFKDVVPVEARVNRLDIIWYNVALSIANSLRRFKFASYLYHSGVNLKRRIFG